MSDVSKIYYNKLKLLGIDDVAHSTRLKIKLLAHIQGLEAHCKGKEIMLLRGADIGSLLADEFGETEESDAVCLVRAANILRRNLAEHLFTFEGSFEPYCQQMFVPTSLLTLISMLLVGPNISE